MRQRRPHQVLALLAALVIAAAAFPATAASATSGHPSAAQRQTLLRYARAHLGVVRGDDRCRHRPAGRQPGGRRDSQRPDVDDQHRGVHVEHGRRRRAGHHRSQRRGPAAPANAPDARDDGAPRAERPVLQLVRPHHGREADRLAADRRPGHADPVVGRQRVARDRPAGRRQRRAGGGRSGRRAVRQHGLRLLLPTRGEPDRLPLHAEHRSVHVLLRHDREREPHRELHRDRQGRDSRPRSTSARGGRSRTPATGAGRRRSPSGSTARISASTSSRAPTRTRTSGSCRAGAGACSRRSCRRCSCRRSNGLRAAGRSITR